MSRWLAGSFDPTHHPEVSGLATALAPIPASVLDCGPLQLACSGPAPVSGDLICLLDGHLDNADQIQRHLGAALDLSPEQLLAAGYRRWGRGILGRMRGDFVLIIWDLKGGEGVIARDQLGVRPFFFHQSDRGLRFASEVRNLLALLARRPDPDPIGVAHWIALSSRPGTETLYTGIRRLGPGEALVLDRRGFRPETYWTPRFEEPPERSANELAAELQGRVEQSVSRRLDAEGKSAVLLSGGLDSSSVAAVGARLTEAEIYACSAGFPAHPAADESELIAELSAAMTVPTICATVCPGGLLASALEHLQAWQLPLLGWGDFWMLPLMRMAAAEGVQTILDGDGGDELFAPRVYLLADLLREGRPDLALSLAHQLPGGGGRPPRRELASVLGSVALCGALPLGVHTIARRTLIRRHAPPWLRHGALQDLISSDDPLAWKRLDGPRWWAHAAYGMAYGVERAGVFEHQRRRAVLAGLQARHPMFDLDLVELSLRVAPEASFDRRYSRPLLRASMAGLVPDSVRLRPTKAWFDSLIIACLTGPDRASVRGLLMRPDAELGAFIDLAQMRRSLFESDLALRQNPFEWMWHVWRLLTAELWLRAQSSSLGNLELDPPPSPARVTRCEALTSSFFPTSSGDSGSMLSTQAHC